MTSLDYVLLVWTSKTFFFFLFFLINQNVTFIARSYRTFSIYVKFLMTASCWNSIYSWQRHPLFDELEGKRFCHIIIITIAIGVTVCSTFSTTAIFSFVLSCIDDHVSCEGGTRSLWSRPAVPYVFELCDDTSSSYSRLTSLSGDSVWLTRR